MAKRKPRRQYKGILAAPPWKHDRTKSMDENWLVYKEVAIQKMNALFDHYEIERDHQKKWELLAFWLADTHVPGFSPSFKRPGQKADPRNSMVDYVLFTSVTEGKRAGKSINYTIRLLTKKDVLFKGKSRYAAR